MRARSIGLALALLSVAGVHAQRAHSAEPQADAGNGRRWLLFVDDLHLDFTATGRLRDCLRTIVAQLAAGEDRIGIVPTGPSSIALDLTRDREAVDRAIGRISGAGLRAADLRSVPRPGRRQPDEVGYRAHIALSTASEVIANLQARTVGERAVVFISNGYDLAVVPEPSGDAAGARPNPPQATDVDVLAFIERAKQLKMRIHTVDPRTLPGTPPIDPADGPWFERTQRTLRDIAEGTGGVAILDAAKLIDQLKQIAAASK